MIKHLTVDDIGLMPMQVQLYDAWIKKKTIYSYK